MIIYRQWKKLRGNYGDIWVCEGWFLFGLIPLYIKRLGAF